MMHYLKGELHRSWTPGKPTRISPGFPENRLRAAGFQRLLSRHALLQDRSMRVVPLQDLLSPDRSDLLWDGVRKAIAEEYGAAHAMPWIVGFSGGKDSTLVAHLVFEHLLSIPRSARRRPVHIVANDTLVESPLVIAHIRSVQDEMRNAATAFDLPVTIATTVPDVDHTFWVNLIGRGYPSPNVSVR